MLKLTTAVTFPVSLFNVHGNQTILQHQAVPDYPHHPTGKGWQERRPAPMCYIRLGVATAYASQSRRADEPLARRQRRRRKFNYWRKPASPLVLSLSAWTAPSICTVNRHAGSHFPVPAIRVRFPLIYAPERPACDAGKCGANTCWWQVASSRIYQSSNHQGLKPESNWLPLICF